MDCLNDGAIENQNAEKEYLGVDGFSQPLKDLDYPQPPISMDILEKKLLTFLNDIRLQDDITIIDLRYKG